MTRAVRRPLAVVVIDTGDGVRSVQVDVGGGTSGINALRQAAAVETVGYGGVGVAVCKVDGVGNPPDNSCLIGPNGAYWSYWRATGGAASWSYSGGGAGATTVHGGDVEGWRYGTGARPNASASYCDYVYCAPPPPPPTDPPVIAAPVPGATGPAGTTGAGTQAGSGAPSPIDAGSGDTAATAGGEPSTTSTTRGESTSNADGRSGRESALASTAGTSGGGGGGSPIGVAIVGALLVIATAVALLVRRRGRGASHPPDPA